MVQEAQLQIKYKKIFPIFLLICSLFILYVTLVVGFTTNSVLGFLFLPLSILMLTRNLVTITPTEIEMKNLLGFTLKTYPYTPGQVSIRNNSIYVNDKKVFSTWWTDVNIRQLRAFFHTEEADFG